ncbi:MAG: tRNA dihydrouridine synthase [Gammaproteobacteria bacterium]
MQIPTPLRPPPRLLLAPMEGLLDPRLRAVLTSAAPYDWCVTEFVRVTQEVLPRRYFLRMAPELATGSRTAGGVPLRVQLLGSDPERMAANATRLLTLAPAGIDLNFGCPAPQVNRHRGGAVLLDEPELLYAVTAAVGSAIGGRTRFSAKMRLGVQDTSRAIEAAQALEAGGAELIVVHARTRDERYRPPAHWSWVARIADAVQVPVVANGEIWTVEDYLRCRAESGRADVMLGRGAIADPFLVERIRARLAGVRERAHAEDWPRLLPMLDDYWQRVTRDLAPRHAPGRLKQWLNLLRRHYSQASQLFDCVRERHDADAIGACLAQAWARCDCHRMEVVGHRVRREEEKMQVGLTKEAQRP